MGLFTKRTETAPCTVEVVHKFEELSAHVRLDNGAVIHPGDKVEVHGQPVMARAARRARGAHRHDHPRQRAGAALDAADRRHGVHGALRVLVLGGDPRHRSRRRGGDGMNVQPQDRARPSAHTADATTVEEGLAIQEERAKYDSAPPPRLAMQNTLLTPRFYTTDFEELDAIDVSPVREDWDKLMERMRSDPNKGHFKKNADWDQIDWEGMEPELKAEFLDFLISSCTAEFSGCVLYKEMKRRGTNADIKELFSATCPATRRGMRASSTTRCARRASR